LVGWLVEVYGPEQFMLGAIPDYDIERPALDRYRDYAGIGTFDQTVCDLPPRPEPPKSPPPVCQEPEERPQTPAAPPPPPTPPPAPTQRQPSFSKGPIPQYDVQEPALDRYRDFAGIGSFDMVGDVCEEHAPLCRSAIFKCHNHHHHRHIFVYLEVDKRNSYKLYKYTNKRNRKMVND